MLNKLSKRAGARIVIHDPANPPLPDEYGNHFCPKSALFSRNPTCCLLFAKRLAQQFLTVTQTSLKIKTKSADFGIQQIVGPTLFNPLHRVT